MFFDVALGTHRLGRMKLELFTDTTPKTAENFRQMCTGEFKKGGVLTKAIKMDILQIAENTNCLTKETASQLSQKDLRGIIDIRNHIAHGYVHVNDEIIWYVIQDCLPTLINEINNLI